MVKRVVVILFTIVLFMGCNAQTKQKPTSPTSLIEARRGFQTKLLRRESTKEPVPAPPAGLFETVRYESPAGKMAAYLSRPPKDGKKHPAIIWIFGGFDNGIGETAWENAPPDNDQSASQFRKAGIVTMYPSLRGGNGNPGYRETFFGEVDDVSAAAEFLAKQEFVDPQRIYLGGHSTGGTLVLLVAETNSRFRAVFSLGPVADVADYGDDSLPFTTSDQKETALRSPLYWLHSITNPVFVFEGMNTPGNADSVKELAQAGQNPKIRFHLVKGADHFSLIGPLNQLLAQKINRDINPACNIGFSAAELDGLFSR